MNISRTIKFAWGAMKNRKLRAMLTILGITIGPAMIVALVGSTQGYSTGITERFNKMGITTLFVSAGFGPPGSSSNLKIDDTMVSTIAQISGTEYVVPYYELRATIKSGSQTNNVEIIALDISKLSTIVPGMTLEEGASPTSMTQAMIGYNIANPTNGSGISLNGVISTSINSRVGNRITQTSRTFIASGILAYFGQGLFINPDDTVFVPLAAGPSLTGSRQYSGLYVIVDTSGDVSSVQSAITDIYGNKIRVTAISSLISGIESVQSSISNILVSVAFMSIIVAFIGIMTTMFTTVAERTREIGTLKSLGYSPRNILSIFLTEATLTGAMGGLAGMALGTILSFFVVGMFGGGGIGFIGFGGPPGGQPGGASTQSSLIITPVITPELLIGTFLMAVCIGALAGLIPSWRASKLIPVVALRHE